MRRSLMMSAAVLAVGAAQAFAQEAQTDQTDQAATTDQTAPADQTAQTEPATGTDEATQTADAGQAGQSDLQTMMGDPKQWVLQAGDYANTRYSELEEINKDNVGDLQVAWTFSTGVLRGHEGGPLVIGDMMYLTTPFPNTVYALDLNNDGRIVWRYDPQQDPNVIAVMCCDTVNRGVAYDNNTIFLHQADTTLVALDAMTGEVKWSVKTGDPSKGETNTATVLPVKDMVLVGVSGGEYGVRGRLSAYDQATGELRWLAYSTGPDEDMLVDPQNTTVLGKPIGENSSIDSWEGDQWQIGGGTTWGWYSYDPELDLIYYGTGNPGTWNPSQRPGDNKWSMTIMARDPDDGMARWFYQKTPHDEWDYDGVNENILVDQEIDGQMRHLLVNFDRNGFAYTLDRETGELLVAKKYDPAVNWATEVVMDPNSDQFGRPQVVADYSTAQGGEDTNVTQICPAALGSKDQQPAAFSPETGLFYVPTNHVCMDYEPFRVSYTAGQPFVGATLSMYPAPNSHGGMGNFIAWDATTGEIKWSLPEQFSVWSGALATAGDIVFYGTLEGYLKAVDATTGEELYRFKTPSGIIGNINTYEHDGKQYVAVLSGIGGWAGIGLAAGLTNPTEGLGAVGGYAGLRDFTALGGQLTVFALPD
ncbi:Methanol dehydrogenase large subunit protein [Rubellimicrobium mesophilum DSM 19309]|uniref:Methanol dehydrogenase large subunit protein n=1 Tax=Rubellimicrobium mesophilum DSM 19309 TaxID=442562 RepID=A0A017HMW6_9RHOB|nr:methanol/ethanol family PQQ-dependent dehydrogenase [Rubellimicrobium mesophilum]EYD75655.1 Methanol dehydrogenase large subunit protein [Rubellimicrobium mesophilum DSM 19309]